MISGFAVNQVYLATGFTDMRKSINGLSLMVSEQLTQDRKRLFFPRRQAKQLDLEAQLLLSNSRAEIDPMPRVRSACQVWESQ